MLYTGRLAPDKFQSMGPYGATLSQHGEKLQLVIIWDGNAVLSHFSISACCLSWVRLRRNMKERRCILLVVLSRIFPVSSEVDCVMELNLGNNQSLLAPYYVVDPPPHRGDHT